MELIMENVRCFAGKHVVPIKPLTVLVGENSSGKTTFLAALSTVSDLKFLFRFQPSFNEPPYSLGNFDTIAAYDSKSKTSAKHFSLGYTKPSDSDDDQVEVVATYKDNRGQVELLKAVFKSRTVEFQLDLNEPDKNYKLVIHPSNEKARRVLYLNHGDILEQAHLESIAGRIAKPKSMEEIESNLARIIELVFSIGVVASIQTLSIAPIRTRPERTYDESKDISPEGAHIPYLLARILKGSSGSEQKKSLVRALDRFGEESGLFERLDVKMLGKNLGDPFQVMVNVSGKFANIIDVGYGVSQALPVVIQSILAAEERLILIQQPEVHLHPKAQAALGSFFVDMVAEGGKQFVVETHSDYIVDRVRQEVAAKKISPESVALLFFEKVGAETTIHNIALDELGNIVDAPPTYREFFLNEELNLLTRGKR